PKHLALKIRSTSWLEPSDSHSRVQPGVKALGNHASTTTCVPWKSPRPYQRPSDPAKLKSGAISPGFSSMRSPKSRVPRRLIRPVKIPWAVAVDMRSALSILENFNGMMPAEDVTPCARMSNCIAQHLGRTDQPHVGGHLSSARQGRRHHSICFREHPHIKSKQITHQKERLCDYNARRDINSKHSACRGAGL